jgi:hypothetical protein
MVLHSRLRLRPARCDIVIRPSILRRCTIVPTKSPAFTLCLVLRQHTSAAQSTYRGRVETECTPESGNCHSVCTLWAGSPPYCFARYLFITSLTSVHRKWSRSPNIKRRGEREKRHAGKQRNTARWRQRDKTVTVQEGRQENLGRKTAKMGLGG